MADPLATYVATSGEAHVFDNDFTSCTVVLKDFVGTLSINSSVQSLKIIVYNECTVNSDIELKNLDKTDKIKVTGDGHLDIQRFKSTSIELQADCTIHSLEGNVIKFESCQVDCVPTTHDPIIYSVGHVWFSDCIVNYEGSGTLIHTPYLLVENATCTIISEGEWITGKGRYQVILDDCLDVVLDDNRFSCVALVLEEIKGQMRPKDFLYVLLADADGELRTIASRRQLYGYDTLSTTLVDQSGSYVKYAHANQHGMYYNLFDRFKEETGFTNVDLHRRINQFGVILVGRGTNYITDEVIWLITHDKYTSNDFEWEAIPDPDIHAICDGTYVYDGHPHSGTPITIETITAICKGEYTTKHMNGYEMSETRSRKYQVGIYSLYSYRTTDMSFHDEKSTSLEFP